MLCRSTGYTGSQITGGKELHPRSQGGFVPPQTASGWKHLRETADAATKTAPGEYFRWTGALFWWKTDTGVSSPPSVLRWSVITVERFESNSFRTQNRKTRLLGMLHAFEHLGIPQAVLYRQHEERRHQARFIRATALESHV